MSRWKKLKRWQKWTVGAVSALIVLGVIGSLASPDGRAKKPFTDAEAQALIDKYEASRSQSVPGTAPSPVPSPPTAAEVKEQARAQRVEAARQRKIAAARARAAAKEKAREAVAAARARAARERVLRGTLVEGYGAKVITLNAAEDGPLVVEASHSGGSNFVVQVVGNGVQELMINEIGSYSGTVALHELAQGRYRMSIEADGSWTVRYRQPQPQGSEPALLRTFQGTGSKVIQVQSPEDLQPIITAKDGGDSNFVVELMAYGDEVYGSELLFNEIGPYSGETLSDIPSGDYLLAVQSAGSWSLRFKR